MNCLICCGMVLHKDKTNLRPRVQGILHVPRVARYWEDFIERLNGLKDHWWLQHQIQPSGVEGDFEFCLGPPPPGVPGGGSGLTFSGRFRPGSGCLIRFFLFWHRSAPDPGA